MLTIKCDESCLVSKTLIIHANWVQQIVLCNTFTKQTLLTMVIEIENKPPRYHLQIAINL